MENIKIKVQPQKLSQYNLLQNRSSKVISTEGNQQQQPIQAILQSKSYININKDNLTSHTIPSQENQSVLKNLFQPQHQINSDKRLNPGKETKIKIKKFQSQTPRDLTSVQSQSQLYQIYPQIKSNSSKKLSHKDLQFSINLSQKTNSKPRPSLPNLDFHDEPITVTNKQSLQNIIENTSFLKKPDILKKKKSALLQSSFFEKMQSQQQQVYKSFKQKPQDKEKKIDLMIRVQQIIQYNKNLVKPDQQITEQVSAVLQKLQKQDNVFGDDMKEFFGILDKLLFCQRDDILRFITSDQGSETLISKVAFNTCVQLLNDHIEKQESQQVKVVLEFQEEINQLKQQIQKLEQNKLETIKQNIKNLEKERAAFEQKINILMEDNSQKKTEISKFRVNKEHMDLEIKKLESENKDKKNYINKLERNLSKMENENYNMEIDYNKLKKESQQQYDSLKEQVDKKLNEKKSLISTLESEISNLRQFKEEQEEKQRRELEAENSGSNSKSPTKLSSPTKRRKSKRLSQIFARPSPIQRQSSSNVNSGGIISSLIQVKTTNNNSENPSPNPSPTKTKKNALFGAINAQNTNGSGKQA